MLRRSAGREEERNAAFRAGAAGTESLAVEGVMIFDMQCAAIEPTSFWLAFQAVWECTGTSFGLARGLSKEFEGLPFLVVLPPSFKRLPPPSI